MVFLLRKLFMKNEESMPPARKRALLGSLCGFLGIFLNLCLFAGKVTVGVLAGAISIISDAFNNLTDAASSVITLFGFRLAAQKPDSDHPFGHGRFEYIAGLLVSLLIMVVGFELGKISVEKIFSPETLRFSPAMLIVLLGSLAVKLYMAFYNRRIGKAIGSGAMLATSLDSLSDTVATAAVLVAMLISHFTNVNIDAYCGLAVSLFILYSGFRSAKETMSPLLGQPPTQEFVDEIEEIVRSFPVVCGIHDLVVHDYGPGRRMISLHAEVPAGGDLLELHDVIDNAEKLLCERLGCDAVIHMDPIQKGNVYVEETRAKVETLVHILDERISIHDFRMVIGPTHTNVLFDALVPFSVAMTEKEAEKKIVALTETLDPAFTAIVHIDR
ncbi:MAG: cation transporter [Clostridia bacterium]|nr:cation transporter [Clostridia bacterium]